MSSMVSRLEKAQHFLDRVVDRANAILVKEVRQSLKSRYFIVTFALLLLGAWLITVFGMMTSDASTLEFGGAGSNFFMWFYIVLAFSVLFFVPFATFQSLSNERNLNTFETLQITTLTPRQIVLGKLWSAVVSNFIYYSVITPFIAFASLLQGFDAFTAAYYLIATFCLSVFLSMAALMVSTFGNQKVTGGLATLFVMGALIFSFSSMIGVAITQIQVGFVPYNDQEFWWFNGFAILSMLLYFWLFVEVAASRLTFEADNRSTGIRVVMFVQLLAFLISVGVLIWWMDFRTMYVDNLVFIPAMTGLHISFFGYFFSTERFTLSHRVRRSLPKRRWLRFLVAPFTPGGRRGYLLVCIAVALMWLSTVALISLLDSSGLSSFSRSPGPLSSLSSTTYTPPTRVLTWGSFFYTFINNLARLVTFSFSTWGQTYSFLTCVCCYVLIYTGVGCLLTHLIRNVSPDSAPTIARTLTLIIVAALVIFPHLLVIIFDLSYYEYKTLFIFDPFYTLGSSSIPSLSKVLLFFCAIIVLLANAPGMFASIKEILNENTSTESAKQPGKKK